MFEKVVGLLGIECTCHGIVADKSAGNEVALWTFPIQMISLKGAFVHGTNDTQFGTPLEFPNDRFTMLFGNIFDMFGRIVLAAEDLFML